MAILKAKSKTKNDDLELVIETHKVTNKIDDSFVGLKIRNGKVDFYYPESYDLDETSLETAKDDLLAILFTISIAKTHSNSNLKIESSFSNNQALPMLSFLWIINDYFKNGFYINREKIIKKNQRGRVDWKRTLNGQPLISKGNVIYKDLVVEVKNDLDNLIVEIHKFCVKKSLDVLGWLFRVNGTSFIRALPFDKGLKNIYIHALKRELNQTFDDLKKLRLSHMLSIVEGLSDKQDAHELVYGVDSYNYVFERMINSIFGNRDANKFNPSADWYLKHLEYEKFPSSDLRPDTILVRGDTAYVLDAKFYRYGYTADKGDLPETASIQKQITYGDFIKNNLGDEIKKIRNAFILPYNKNNNKLRLNNIIEYIGYSKTDYRKGLEDHEIIHAFLIDLKYAVTTWNKLDHGDDVDTLIKEIEEIQKTRIKEEKDKAYLNSIVKIKEGQSFQGSVLSSFYATRDNLKLKEALIRNQILYADGCFVINDAKYVVINGNKKHLTEYAIRHMDECCLAFDNDEDSSSDTYQFDFCRSCESRKNVKSQSIKVSDEHNQSIYSRAQDADIDRVIEDNRSALDLCSRLNGSFGYNLKVLLEENEKSVNGLKTDSHIDNHKINKMLDGEVMPTIRDCVAICVAFDLHPIVSHHLLLSAGYDLSNSSSEQWQFYDFLITYCSGEFLNDWNIKIAATRHFEWQIP